MANQMLRRDAKADPLALAGHVLLALVILSPFALLPLGLNSPVSAFQALHVPTMVLQVMFIAVTALQGRLAAGIRLMPPAQLIALGVLFAYVLLVSLTTPYNFGALLGSFWLVHICFFLTVVVFLRGQADRRPHLIWLVLGVASAAHLCTFYIAFLIWPETVANNGMPVFENIRHFGYIMAPAAVVMVAMLVTDRRRLVLPLLCYGAATFFIYHSGSRGGALAILFGLSLSAAYAWWLGLRIFVDRVSLVLAVTALVIFASVILPPFPWLSISARTAATLAQTGSELLLGGRAVAWAQSIELITQNWVFGYGPIYMGHLQELEVSRVRHPHNIGLQLLLHWGVVGTAIVAIAVATFSKTLSAALRMRPEKSIYPLAVLITMLVHALVDGGLYYTFSVAVAIIAFAMLDRIGWQVRQAELDAGKP